MAPRQADLAAADRLTVVVAAVRPPSLLVNRTTCGWWAPSGLAGLVAVTRVTNSSWSAPKSLLVVGSAFPFYWAILASFTPEARLFQDPSLIPSELVLDHYRALFTERSFWLPIRNSFIVAGATTVFCVGLGALCAYALARMEFRGKALLLGAILAVGMFPQISVVSPLYLLLRALRHVAAGVRVARPVDQSHRHEQDAVRLAGGVDGAGKVDISASRCLRPR